MELKDAEGADKRISFRSASFTPIASYAKPSCLLGSFGGMSVFFLHNNVSHFFHVSCEVQLTARLYSVRSRSARTIKVVTRSSGTCGAPRYPYVEAAMNPALQSYVHDILVSCTDNRRKHRFRVFFKRHSSLPVNPNFNIQGDIVIMRVAVNNSDSVVNLRSRDTRLADRLLRR